MDPKDFLKTSKSVIRDYIAENSDNSEEFRIYTVWSAKTLQNNKALLDTTLSDDMYYQSTYDGDKGEIYVEAYKKVKSITHKV
ncbi:hypothetical protein C7K38_01330 [Tetragenococcus osmophilus]|uniref:Phage protein n=1 Tax=Tetragenococcus osmophilus TaxID=526944 RepID=A0AA38CSU0_9ENTE|nr:DUF6275 family protein [Tetragenococcus osmophilus]AYW47132.1 hypothetical protein C7K38_01330 [Tetragenococcus osmophilus]GMA71018.1 hypothetical protein GCM10025885_00670 [Tetragenococcus osmophilus]